MNSQNDDSDRGAASGASAPSGDAISQDDRAGSVPYTVFRSTLVAIYVLMGGTRLLTDDLTDLADICDYLVAQGKLSWPDEQYAAARSIETIIEEVSRLPATQAMPVPKFLTNLRRRNDQWSILAQNADPQDIVLMLGQLHDRRCVQQLSIERIVNRRRGAWQSRVVEKLYDDRRTLAANGHGPAGAVGQAEGLGATLAALRDLGVDTSGLWVRNAPTGLPRHFEPSDPVAGHAEWARFCDYVVADLRSDAPRLRVAVTCPSCQRRTLWSPKTGLEQACCAKGPKRTVDPGALLATAFLGILANPHYSALQAKKNFEEDFLMGTRVPGQAHHPARAVASAAAKALAEALGDSTGAEWPELLQRVRTLARGKTTFAVILTTSTLVRVEGGLHEIRPSAAATGEWTAKPMVCSGTIEECRVKAAQLGWKVVAVEDLPTNLKDIIDARHRWGALTQSTVWRAESSTDVADRPWKFGDVDELLRKTKHHRSDADAVAAKMMAFADVERLVAGHRRRIEAWEIVARVASLTWLRDEAIGTVSTREELRTMAREAYQTGPWDEAIGTVSTREQHDAAEGPGPGPGRINVAREDYGHHTVVIERAGKLLAHLAVNMPFLTDEDNTEALCSTAADAAAICRAESKSMRERLAQ